MTFKDPHSLTDTTQTHIEHIDFDLAVDFKTRMLSGEARYQLAHPPAGALFLDTRDIQIDAITSNGRTLSWSLGPEDEFLGQRLQIEGLEKDTQFTIAYCTGPGASALQWQEPSQTAGGQHPFLFSQCQAIHARSVIPCQDTPAVRFTFTAALRVPTPLKAVMAAAPQHSETQNGWTTYHFRMPQPIPAYLLALAVGNLVARDLSPRCRLYAEPETLAAAAWEFAETEVALQIAEALFGPYEWERYDMLVMPPSFPYGGMENPRLTFLTPTLLAGDRSLTDVITHELAHSWTGNLVTNATWEDFWLNEGWTVYAERRITENMRGRDFVQLQAAIGRNKMFDLFERFGPESQLTCLKFNQEGLNPLGILTEIQYIKGCEFLTLLETVVGRARFDPFVQKYIARFRFQSLTTEAFVEFLCQELPEVASQVDLDAWLYQPGFPDSAVPIQSRLFDQVNQALQDFAQGKQPLPETVEGWDPHQIYLFLLEMPKEIPVEDCRYLESLFGLETGGNDLILSAFYEIAIRSGYREIWPRVEAKTAQIGRILLTARLYRAMTLADWARPLARPLFEKHRARHHPITVAAIDNILAQAGL